MPFNLTNSSQTCFGAAISTRPLMENLHDNFCEDMLLILKQKNRRRPQCSPLSLGSNMYCFFVVRLVFLLY